MRQLTKNTTIEDIIFDLKDDGQNELAEWLQDNYIVNKAINEEAMCQDSYDEGYEVGYDDGYDEGCNDTSEELNIESYEKGYKQGLIDAKKKSGVHSISQ